MGEGVTELALVLLILFVFRWPMEWLVAAVLLVTLPSGAVLLFTILHDRKRKGIG